MRKRRNRLSLIRSLIKQKVSEGKIPRGLLTSFLSEVREEVEELREVGLDYSAISDYLKKRYGVAVGRETIRKFLTKHSSDKSFAQEGRFFSKNNAQGEGSAPLEGQSNERKRNTSLENPSPPSPVEESAKEDKKASPTEEKKEEKKKPSLTAEEVARILEKKKEEKKEKKGADYYRRKYMELYQPVLLSTEQTIENGEMTPLGVKRLYEIDNLFKLRTERDRKKPFDVYSLDGSELEVSEKDRKRIEEEKEYYLEFLRMRTGLWDTGKKIRNNRKILHLLEIAKRLIELGYPFDPVEFVEDEKIKAVRREIILTREALEEELKWEPPNMLPRPHHRVELRNQFARFLENRRLKFLLYPNSDKEPPKREDYVKEEEE